MIENEDKCPHNDLIKIYWLSKIFHILENMYLILISILNIYLRLYY